MHSFSISISIFCDLFRSPTTKTNRNEDSTSLERDAGKHELSLNLLRIRKAMVVDQCESI